MRCVLICPILVAVIIVAMPRGSRHQRQLAQPQRQACQHAVARCNCADQRQAAQGPEPREAQPLVALHRQAHRQLYVVQLRQSLQGSPKCSLQALAGI